MRHLLTWRAFLEHLTALGSDKFTDAERRALAEALSMASPDCPRGVQCADGCAQHDTSEDKEQAVFVLGLLERLLERDGTLELRDLTEVRMAMRQRDLTRSITRFPHVWKVINKLVG